MSLESYQVTMFGNLPISYFSDSSSGAYSIKPQTIINYARSLDESHETLSLFRFLTSGNPPWVLNLCNMQLQTI